MNDNPALLFPLRLEIRNGLERVPGVQGRRLVVAVRWYPDDLQLFPAVSGVTPEDEAAHAVYAAAVARAGADGEQARAAAWAALVRAVGLHRARQLTARGVDRPLKTFEEPSAHDALHQFLERGAAMKLLPERVSLFTISSPGGVRRVARLATGAPIPRKLVFSVDERAAPWVNDFQEAVRVGMGAVLRDRAQVAQVVAADWLFALGHDEGGDRDGLVEELLLRHKAVGDLEVVAQDSPTNDTGAGSTGVASNPAGTAADAVSYADAPVPGAFSAGDLLASALGLDPGVLDGLSGAASREQRAAFGMGRLLWYAATHDYRSIFMNYATSSGVHRVADDAEAWEAVADHFLNHVIGRGLLPSLRIGPNPYGVLPVTSLAAWEPAEAAAPRVEAALRKVAATCVVLQKKLLRLATRPDPGGLRPTLAEVPEDARFAALVRLLQQRPVSYRADLQTVADADGGVAYDRDPVHIDAPAVPERGGAALRMGIGPALDAILQQPGATDVPAVLGASFIAETRTPPAPLSLLEWMLRAQAIDLATDLVEANRAHAAAIAAGDTASGDAARRDHARVLHHARAVRAELQELSSLAAGPLETLFFEVLDCFSHRLDAWTTSLAHRRLLRLDVAGARAERRSSGPNLLGVYGWLERPFVRARRASAGYFQAPSLDQATAAALLRAGALGGGDALQLDLSSRRVRDALGFLDGLRAGHTAAELLGRRAERLLHERGLDRHLSRVRAAYPLTAQDGTAAVEPAGSIVVNGEALLADADGARLDRAVPAAALAEVREELRRTRDAVADLTIAESVYQVVRGNTARSAAWLEAAEGKSTPPDAEFVATPRTGISQVQRVVYPLPPGGAATDPRAAADPAVAAFCERQLAGARDAVLRVTIRARAPDELVHAALFTLAELDVSALDLVVGGRPELEARARVAACGVLAEDPVKYRFLGEPFFAAPSPAELDRAAFVVCDAGAAANGAPTLESFLTRASTIALLLRDARAVGPEDLAGAALPARDPASLEELVAARLRAFDALSARLEALTRSFEADRAALAATPPPAGAALASLLGRASRYGIPEAIALPRPEALPPVLAAMDARAASFSGGVGAVALEVPGGAPLVVRVQGGELQRRSAPPPGERWERADDPGVRLAGTGAALKQACALLRARTQATMPVFSPVWLESPLAPGVASGPDPAFTVAAPSAALDGYARVRGPLARLLALLARDRDGAGAPMAVFTYAGTQRIWEDAVREAIGDSRLPPSARPDPGDVARPGAWRSSNVDLRYVGPRAGEVLAAGAERTAIVVDEWTDFLPSPVETTGIGFHLEAPRSEAPQVILCAVPPAAEWRDRDRELPEIVADTIDLLRIRALPAEAVPGSSLGCLLPALVFSASEWGPPTRGVPLVEGSAPGGFWYEVSQP